MQKNRSLTYISHVRGRGCPQRCDFPLELTLSHGLPETTGKTRNGIGTSCPRLSAPRSWGGGAQWVVGGGSPPDVMHCCPRRGALGPGGSSSRAELGGTLGYRSPGEASGRGRAAGPARAVACVWDNLAVSKLLRPS